MKKLLHVEKGANEGEFIDASDIPYLLKVMKEANAMGIEEILVVRSFKIVCAYLYLGSGSDKMYVESRTEEKSDPEIIETIKSIDSEASACGMVKAVESVIEPAVCSIRSNGYASKGSLRYLEIGKLGDRSSRITFDIPINSSFRDSINEERASSKLAPIPENKCLQFGVTAFCSACSSSGAFVKRHVLDLLRKSGCEEAIAVADRLEVDCRIL